MEILAKEYKTESKEDLGFEIQQQILLEAWGIFLRNSKEQKNQALISIDPQDPNVCIYNINITTNIQRLRNTKTRLKKKKRNVPLPSGKEDNGDDNNIRGS